MIIGVSINEVLRDLIGQFVYTYEKYIEKTDVKESEVTSINFNEFFKFTNN